MKHQDFDWWPAPAKLNLMLKIVGRRQDGYHLLQTVFRFIDFSDQLGFKLRHDGIIRRLSGNESIVESDDLIIRAAQLLQRAAGCAKGVDIALVKNIPMGGGLGGGSSDAATVLVALNHLWGADYPIDKLVSLGLELGADVPVFIQGKAAWAEGVGEELTPIQLPDAWYVVLVPDCHVSTAEVFRDPQLTRNAPRTTIRDFLAGRQGNDCLPVVLKHYRQVKEAFDWLALFASAQLTGTGGCVFAAFESEIAARHVFMQVPEQFQAFVAQGLDYSPLMQLLSSKQNIGASPSG
ncbi:4-(cytidine 5'-diphospho)-2-C-methyl-D-erythritol kinase [Sedimenticola selenatireducens]|uniref:4-diphosphocytidyl-2-C-methyl-D-erythritol kinase n=1 Tax=Sedimenticola selenatireducens TaxID=191960 RepID=A0A557SGL7_9GAMM|nr:4-(cytidine 5'-diphospho)-2-C-methyl-D-erythritol kinase [Sedimenticola selenatireducens]TVO76567.1 4-(cytidine 5'-diphospho)-2-C-methyl-D-erythritol kinase [Sedimenticola selenatireducens]TVT64011.1 MAG: 4-(cytidine 5'-diphospho)-2-C-methyl-D-erythritol kinase [Sedimenticola selenatireducens]